MELPWKPFKHSPHGSFGTYNRNYLLSAGLSSGGILVEELTRQDMIKKFNDIRFLSALHISIFNLKYKYMNLVKKLGTFEENSELLNSLEFKWNKATWGTTYIPQIISSIHQYCNNGIDGEFNWDKLNEILPEEVAIKFRTLVVDWGYEDCFSSFRRKRSAFGEIESILEEQLKLTQIREFNKGSVDQLNALANEFNLEIYRIHVGRTNSSDWRQLEYPDNVKVMLVDYDFSSDEFISSFDTNSILVGLFSKAGDLSKRYVNEIKLKVKSYSDYCELIDLYNEFSKYKDLGPFDVFSPVETYSELNAIRDDLQEFINISNLNSPAIKSRLNVDAINAFGTGGIASIILYECDHTVNETWDTVEGNTLETVIPKYSDKEFSAKLFKNQNIKSRYDSFVLEDPAGLIYIHSIYKTLGGKDIEKLYSGKVDGESELEEAFRFVINYILYNSIHKQLSGYIEGQLEKDLYPIWDIRDDFTYITGKTSEKWKDYLAYKPYWNVMGVTTKRWSAGIHTWRQGTDVFRTLIAEPDCVAVYFDISQAEVRFAAYISGDEKMIDWYNRGVDIYVKMAQIQYPNEDASFHKQMRSPFKSIVLGLLYGRGANSIANQLETDANSVRAMIKTFKDTFPQLNEFIDRKKKFAEDHGYIETFLGDKLFFEEGRAYTCGINYFVQNGASTILNDGFYNIYENAYRTGHYTGPKIVVHDSHTMATHISNIFNLLENIKTNFKGYMNDKYGIPLKYDLLTFSNFRDKLDLSYDEENGVMELAGNELGLKAWMDKFNKFFTYDVIEEIETSKSKTLIQQINHSQIKLFTYYPDNNFIVPRKLKLKINNIKSK